MGLSREEFLGKPGKGSGFVSGRFPGKAREVGLSREEFQGKPGKGIGFVSGTFPEKAQESKWVSLGKISRESLGGILKVKFVLVIFF